MDHIYPHANAQLMGSDPDRVMNDHRHHHPSPEFRAHMDVIRPRPMGVNTCIHIYTYIYIYVNISRTSGLNSQRVRIFILVQWINWVALECWVYVRLSGASLPYFGKFSEYIGGFGTFCMFLGIFGCIRAYMDIVEHTK